MSAETHWPWYLAGITLIAVVLHLPLLDGTFIAVDDHKQISSNPLITDLTWTNFKEIAFTNFLNRNHNPMYISFTLNWALTPKSYTGFVVVNLVFLVGTILIFFRFAGLFVVQRSWQLLATALFSVHSTHVDIVAWISARCHLMGLFFFLLAFLAWNNYRRELGQVRRVGWYLTAMLCAWMAVWNKNIFFSIGISILIFDLYKRRKASLVMLLDKLPLFFFGVVPVYILGTSTHYLRALDRPAMGGSLAATVYNDFSLLVQYLYHLIIPTPTYVWIDVYPVSGLLETSMDAGLWAMRLTPLLNLGLLIAVLIGMIALYRRHQLRLPLFFAIFSLVALAPAMNIPPKWVEFAFRYDLIPSAFFCPAIAAAGAAVWSRWPKIGRPAVLATVASLYLGHLAVSYAQCLAWDTERDLLQRCVKHYPDAKPCQGQLSTNYKHRGCTKAALGPLLKIEELRMKPNCIRVTASALRLARLYATLGNNRMAKFYFQRALKRDRLRSADRRSIRARLKQLNQKSPPRKPTGSPRQG